MVMKMEWNGLYRLTQVDISPYGRCLRLESVPEEKPKKTVVKEVVASCAISDFGHSKEAHYWNIPRNARNIKCTYEVEE